MLDLTEFQLEQKMAFFMPIAKEIAALFPSDEMRHPYEAAVLSLGVRILWFSSFQDTLAIPLSKKPLAVIIDLDCLPSAWESELESFKTHFPNSDLIGFSSNDSAQAALRCIRSGFHDFLLKPVSPEEFAWSVSKCLQRQELFQRLSDTKTRAIQAITQISTSTTPSLLRLCVVEHFQRLLEGTGAAWVLPSNKRGDPPSILCALPRTVSPPQVFGLFPKRYRLTQRTAPLILRSRKQNLRKIYFPCRGSKNGGLFVWNIRSPVGRKTLSEAIILLEQAEISLLNLQKYEEIKHQTFVDDLTGLYNSRYLKFALNTAILKYNQSQRPFAVLFIDVDHFKSINDQHGHLVGSAFLVAIGKTIRNTVRHIDAVFRYGGDEFVVLLQDASKKGAHEIAERIRKHVERRMFVIEKARVQTTVSIGIAVYPEHSTERETLLRLADEAMYYVKNESRNAVHLAFGLRESEKPKNL